VCCDGFRIPSAVETCVAVVLYGACVSTKCGLATLASSGMKKKKKQNPKDVCGGLGYAGERRLNGYE
jgi:hypothetical protein